VGLAVPWIAVAVKKSGLRIRGILVRIRILQIRILKTDPDPDPTHKKAPIFPVPHIFLLVL